MAKKTLLQRIKGWFSGNQSAKSSGSSGSSKRTNYYSSSRKDGGRGYYRRSMLNSLTGKEEEEKPKYKSMATATKSESQKQTSSFAKLDSALKKDVPDPKRAAALKSQERAKENLNKTVKAVKDWNDSNKQQKKEFNERTNHKYDVKYWEEKGDKKKAQEARIRVKSGENTSDIVAEELAVKYHPIAYSAARGAASGATFGASELAIKAQAKRDEERAKNEQYYQEHKSKGAEMAGELVGSLASFGGASKGAAKGVGKALGTKTGKKAVAKLAGTKFAQNSAKKALTRGVEKELLGAGESLGREMLEEVAKSKTKKVLSNLGENALVDLTAGSLYDFNKATSKYKVGSPEWKKEMRENALFNIGVGAGGVAISHLGNKSALEEAIETVGKRDAFRKSLNNINLADAKGAREGATSLAEDMAKMKDSYTGDARNVMANAPDIMSKGELGSRSSYAVPTLDDAIKSRRRTRATLGLGGIDVRKPENLTAQEKSNLASLRQSIDNTIANIEGEALKQTDESKILRSQSKKIEDVLDKAEGISKADKKAAKEVTAKDLINETNAETVGGGTASTKVPKEQNEKWASELEEANEKLKAMRDKAPKNSAERKRLDEQIKANEEGIESLKKKADDTEQINLEDAIETTKKDSKAQKPKTKKQKAQAEAQERSMLNSVQRKREEMLDAEIRKKTNGEYGYRKGEHTSMDNVSLDEARQIERDSKGVANRLKEKGVKDLFNDDSRPLGVFKTANKAEMDKVSREAAVRVRQDPQAVIKRLRDLDARLIAEADKSALISAEHITFDDIADITAIEQMFEEAGVQVPKEYEEAFSHIMEWQGTEAGQMLKMRDLYLKENSKAYRKKLLSRDVDKYLRKVLNLDDVAIADLKRSIDANNGKGYFDKMMDALSDFKGVENEAAFRKAYADFQAEIFMNTKPTVWDAVNLWRHSFMLSSPKTGFNNIIGNLMQRAMYRVSDAMNLAGESMAQAINPDVKRTTALLKSKDQRRLAGMYTSGRRGEHNLKNANYLSGFEDQAFADAINTAADADVADMMASSKYVGDVIKGLKYKPQTVGGKVKQGFVKGGRMGSEYVSIMLNEPDSWFVERNYRSALLKYLEANGVNSAETLATKDGEKLLKEARAYAKDIALENTYKKANNVVEFLEGLRRKGHTKGSNAGYKAAAIMLDAELPYLKVPANLIVNNFKYSPLGLGKGAVDAFRGVVKGDAELLNRATRELSKGLTGTGMAALGYMMFCRDQMDDDSWGFVANADDSLKEYGMRDNSFKIGDHTFNISNMGIGAVQFLIGAAFAEDLAAEDATPPHQVALDALSKTVDTVADMSLMENAVSLLDLFGNGGNYDMTVSERLGNAGTEIAGDYAAQFIPNPLRGVAKGMTDADLDTGVNKNADRTKVQRVLERNKNNFIQGLPVLNEKLLPHKVDSHGNLVNEKNTAEDKWTAIANNTLNPLTATKVKIPEVDKEELKVKRENGDAFKPRGFDPNRKYQAQIGSGDTKEVIDLTGKEREQVARSAKNSGYDSALNVVKKGMFGDRLGERAQQVLREIPDDEEKAREYIFSTPEWKNASNAQKETWLKAWYGEGSHGKGVDRTRSREAYVNIAGNSEDDFRWQNDITPKNQQKYNDYALADIGISKGQWVDILESCADTNHKWNEETLKNQDTINSAKKTKLGILAVEGLTPEQRIAAYNVIRGKRTGFGWNDWDGVTGGGSGYRHYGGYRRSGGGGGKSKVPTINAKSMAAATKSAKGTKVKLEPPTPKTTPKVTTKFRKYDI